MNIYRPKKYVEIIPMVEAIQFDGTKECAEAICIWAKVVEKDTEYFKVGGLELRQTSMFEVRGYCELAEKAFISITDGTGVVKIVVAGDWVVKNLKFNWFFLYSSEDFNRKYKEILEMSDREKLPNRREHEMSRELVYEEISFFVGLGMSPESGKISEVFIRPSGEIGKSGQFARICDDVGLLMSFLLQYGITTTELTHAVGRMGGVPGEADADNPKPASFIGAILDFVDVRQKELNEQMEGTMG